MAYGVNKKVELLNVYTPMQEIEPGKASVLFNVFRRFPHHYDQIMRERKKHVDRISIVYDAIKVVMGSSTKINHNP